MHSSFNAFSKREQDFYVWLILPIFEPDEPLEQSS